jgi:hypothetical protein
MKLGGTEVNTHIYIHVHHLKNIKNRYKYTHLIQIIQPQKHNYDLRDRGAGLEWQGNRRKAKKYDEGVADF